MRLLTVLVVPAHADAPASADFRSYLDQAKFFLKKAWYEDAAEQLELAVKTDDGEIDPEAWFLLAKVRYELCDLNGARFAVDRALVHSRDQTQALQTLELQNYLNERFGYVQLTAPYGGMATHIEVELQSVIFDPDLKNWLQRLLAKLDDEVTLPTVLGLPTGRYTINGMDVEILAGQEVVVAPPLQGSTPASLQTVEVEVGFGGTVWIGPTVGNILPSPTTQLSAGLPLGVLVVGAMAEWTPTPYRTRIDQVEFAAGSFSVGVRVGVEVPGTQPVVIRPSLVYRYGSLPGIEVGCSEGDAEWVCFSGDTAPSQLVVYTSGKVHIPGVEIAALYRDRSRARGLGFGVKGSGEFALGTLPAQDTAQRLSDAGPIDYRVDPATRPVQAMGIRVLGAVSYAF